MAQPVTYPDDKMSRGAVEHGVAQVVTATVAQPTAHQERDAQNGLHHPLPPTYQHGSTLPPIAEKETTSLPPAQAPQGEIEQVTAEMPGLLLPPPPSHPSMSDPAFPSHSASSEYTAPPPPPSHKPYAVPPDDPSLPTAYLRSPTILTAYLVPFPVPSSSTTTPPPRFMIYTPPPPPHRKPTTAADKKAEGHIGKVQRKWQAEVREAHENDGRVKLASWKGFKGKATQGIDWAIGKTTSADLDFLTRVNAMGEEEKRAGKAEKARLKEAEKAKAQGQGKIPAAGTGVDSGTSTPGSASSSDDELDEPPSTTPPPKLEEMVLVYPPSMGNDEAAIRAEFVNTMMRTKSKAERDAIIGTALLPVTAAVDIAITLVWPFGGLLEVDAVWTYASAMGARTARSVVKRVGVAPTTTNASDPDAAAAPTSTATSKPGKPGKPEEETLRLTFRPSQRNDVLRDYLAHACASAEPKLFSRPRGPTPTPSDVLAAIGWEPRRKPGDKPDRADEAWQSEKTREDVKVVMGKAAAYWIKWCKAYAKNPKKALKK